MNMELSFKYQSRRATILLIGSALSLLVMLSPPLEIIENSNLLVRMIEAILIFVYGIMFGYALERYSSFNSMARPQNAGTLASFYSVITRLNKRNKGVVFAMLVPSIVVAYWSFPSIFDATATNIFIRYQSDLTYLFVAILAGTAITFIPRRFKILLLYFAFTSVGMMGSMMLVYPQGFYSAYSASQNATMATFMMLFGAAGIFGGSPWLLKVMDVI
jgi:hypothetical protein